MPQSCCGAVSHWSDPTTARAVPIVHSIAHLRVCTDRGPGEHFDTRSKPRSRSERWVTALQSGERSLVSRILQRVPSGERKWQCARAARRSVARARGRADRRARSADGKARSAPVRSPWMRSQPQHYTACVGTCPALVSCLHRVAEAPIGHLGIATQFVGSKVRSPGQRFSVPRLRPGLGATPI
jgi:hypothetical protein